MEGKVINLFKSKDESIELIELVDKTPGSELIAKAIEKNELKAKTQVLDRVARNRRTMQYYNIQRRD